MVTSNLPERAGTAIPENGEGCEPASCTPFKTIDNTQVNFAGTQLAKQAASLRLVDEARADLRRLQTEFAKRRQGLPEWKGHDYLIVRARLDRMAFKLDVIEDYLRSTGGAK